MAQAIQTGLNRKIFASKEFLKPAEQTDSSTIWH
jgi:hypothetical protein